MYRVVLGCLIVVLFCSSVAVAVPVDPDAEDGIAALRAPEAESYYWALCTTGQVYMVHAYGQTFYSEERSHLDVPVPVSEIQDWEIGVFITTSGVHWMQIGGTNGDWQIVDAEMLGCEPIPVKKSSFGGLKAKFGKKKPDASDKDN